MTVPDAVVQAVVEALPGAALWDDGTPFTATDLLVFDGLVPPTPPNRYAVVYIDPGTLSALAVCGVSDDLMVRWQITSVAPDRQQAAWIASTARDGTVDTRPVVSGWECGQVIHTYAQMLQRDEAVMERPVVYQVDLYELRAARVSQDSSSN